VYDEIILKLSSGKVISRSSGVAKAPAAAVDKVKAVPKSKFFKANKGKLMIGAGLGGALLYGMHKKNQSDLAEIERRRSGI
jgi:hypothetical protein